MTIPQWTLVYFSLWTLAVLIALLMMRSFLILHCKAQFNSFRADELHGSLRYRRTMRAHANCLENLPIYGVIIFAITLIHLNSILLNTLAICFLIARICQTIIHIGFKESNTIVMIRFSFFFIQLSIMFWMLILIILKHPFSA